ncbi:MAG TPA: hypothetical protein P5081_02690 [Phycisphaerae bacterium]|nr:hypothetical protein [Phycisphaerae bacterium]HRW51765.1 hypothetical protein [Phycisphaerae bacterium]
MSYDVTMWLSYTPLESVAEEEFRKRFPLSLEAAWKSLAMSASTLTSLANQLNGQILSDCKSYLDSDTGLNVTEVIAFTTSAWTGGGGHGTPTPVDIDVKLPSSAPWTFSVGGEDYQMTASCTFEV